MSGVLLAGHFLLWTASLKYTSIAASVLPRLTASDHRHAARDGACSANASRAVRSPAARSRSSARSSPAQATCALDSRAFGGDLLAIGGAVCLAGYLLIGRSVRTDLGVAGYSAIVYAVVCVIAATTAVAGGVAHLPSPRVALACCGLALVCTIGGHTVYNWALRHVPVLLVSVSFLGEPPLTAMLALLILGAVPSLATDAGRRADPRRARARAGRARRALGTAAAPSRSPSDGRHRVRPSVHRKRSRCSTRTIRRPAIASPSSAAASAISCRPSPAPSPAELDRYYPRGIPQHHEAISGRHGPRAVPRAPQPDPHPRAAARRPRRACSTSGADPACSSIRCGRAAGGRAAPSDRHRRARQARDVFHLDVRAAAVDDLVAAGCDLRCGGAVARRRAPARAARGLTGHRAPPATRRCPARRRPEFRLARGATRTCRLVPPRRPAAPRPLHPLDPRGDARRPPDSTRARWRTSSPEYDLFSFVQTVENRLGLAAEPAL